MPETRTDDDAVIAQLRAWADDLAGQIPPTAASAIPERRRRMSTLAVAAAVLVVLGLIGVGLWVATDDDPAEDVKTGTTTEPPPSSSSAPAEAGGDVPLLETTWALEQVAVDGQDPVDASDASLWLYLSESQICDGSGVCPEPDAFLVGSDGCDGYVATVSRAGDRLTARPFTPAPTSAPSAGCPPSDVIEIGDLVRPLGDGASTATIDGDVLTLRSDEGTTATFRAHVDATGPVPEGLPVFVDGDGTRHRWSWSSSTVEVVDTVSLDVEGFEPQEGSSTTLTLPIDAASGTISAATLVEPDVIAGLVAGPATSVTVTRGETAVEMPTRPLEGQPGLVAFTGAAPDGDEDWSVVATDADGEVVAEGDSNGDVSQPPPSTSPADLADVPLRDTVWWLELVETDEGAFELPTGELARVRIGPCRSTGCTGDAISGDDGCNSFGGPVVVGAETFVVGADRFSTAAGCGDELSGWVESVTTGEVTYEVEGERLRLWGSGGVIATLYAGDGAYPPVPEGASVVEAPDLPDDHRLTWREVGAGRVQLRLDVAEDLPRYLRVDLSLDRGSMVAAAREGVRPSVVIGLVDARATEVTFDRQDGSDPTTDTVGLPGRDDLRAFVIPVPGVSGAWSLIATDADGTTVATFDPPR